MDQDGHTWQGIKMTPAVHDWLAERGYSTFRTSKREDAESIIGPELLAELEAAELRLQGFEVRAEDALDPALFVLKDEHEPRVNPVSLLLESGDDYQMALDLIQPLFEIALSNIVTSQMDPKTVIAEAGQIASAARPLKRDAPSVLAEASKLAKSKLAAMPGAVDVQRLDQASSLLVEYLRSTHFPAVQRIRADEDSAEIMTATQKRMLSLIEPSIDQVPEATAAHLPELIESVVSAIVDDIQTEDRTMDNFPIPQAEYANQKSDHDVTPRLRAMLRANEGLDRAARPAPLVQRAPVSTGGPSIAQINQAVSLALAPIAAEIAALKARGATVTRSAPRRAIAPPQISRSAVRSAMGLEPLVTRTVETNIHGGLPSRRAVFSPKEVARRSYGLPMITRSAEVRPSVFRSRFQSELQFASAAARDQHDASLQQPAGIISPGTPAKLAGPSIWFSS